MATATLYNADDHDDQDLRHRISYTKRNIKHKVLYGIMGYHLPETINEHCCTKCRYTCIRTEL